MSMIKTVTAGFSKMLATKKHGATKNRRWQFQWRISVFFSL